MEEGSGLLKPGRTVRYSTVGVNFVNYCVNKEETS
jgi:hypothetical protein